MQSGIYSSQPPATPEQFFVLLYYMASRELGQPPIAAQAAREAIVEAIETGLDSDTETEPELRKRLLSLCADRAAELGRKHGANGLRGLHGPRMGPGDTEIERTRHQVLIDLEELAWLAIVFHYVEGLEPGEAARQMGMGIPAYERIRDRTVAELRSRFRRFEGGGEGGFNIEDGHPMDVALSDGGAAFATIESMHAAVRTEAANARLHLSGVRSRARRRRRRRSGGGGGKRLLAIAGAGVLAIAAMGVTAFLMAPKLPEPPKPPPPPALASIKVMVFRDGQMLPLGNELFPTDTLKFSYSNEAVSGLKHLAVLGLDTEGNINWYLRPDDAQADDSPSVAIEEDRALEPVGEQTVAHHPLGLLEICALFTDKPLVAKAVQATFDETGRWPPEAHRHCFEADIVASPSP